MASPIAVSCRPVRSAPRPAGCARFRGRRSTAPARRPGRRTGSDRRGHRRALDEIAGDGLDRRRAVVTAWLADCMSRSACCPRGRPRASGRGRSPAGAPVSPTTAGAPPPAPAAARRAWRATGAGASARGWAGFSAACSSRKNGNRSAASGAAARGRSHAQQGSGSTANNQGQANSKPMRFMPRDPVFVSDPAAHQRGERLEVEGRRACARTVLGQHPARSPAEAPCGRFVEEAQPGPPVSDATSPRGIALQCQARSRLGDATVAAGRARGDPAASAASASSTRRRARRRRALSRGDRATSQQRQQRAPQRPPARRRAARPAKARGAVDVAQIEHRLGGRRVHAASRRVRPPPRAARSACAARPARRLGRSAAAEHGWHAAAQLPRPAS